MCRQSFACSIVLSCIFLLPLTGSAQQIELKAGQGFRLPFPDLPPTVFANHINPKIQTGFSVHLPENYSKEGKFPLCVYLEGGLGGNGENTQFPRRVIGNEDYIVVNFPLFRKAGYDRSSYLDGIIVGMDDYSTISEMYRVFLEKLNETIPNIDPERSIIGGHSNGAKTACVLLSAMDETALESFRGFFFVDGGFTWSSYCRTKELEDHYILFVVGGGRGQQSSGRKSIVARMDGLRDFANQRGMSNWQFEVVPNREHEFAEEYHEIIRKWAKGFE